MGVSRQEYWSGLPRPPPGDLPDSRTTSLVSPVLSGGFFTTSTTWEALWYANPFPKALRIQCTSAEPTNNHRGRLCTLLPRAISVEHRLEEKGSSFHPTTYRERPDYPSMLLIFPPDFPKMFHLTGSIYYCEHKMNEIYKTAVTV